MPSPTDARILQHYAPRPGPDWAVAVANRKLDKYSMNNCNWHAKSKTMNDDLHRILIKGGVTSPGELKEIVLMLEAAGLKQVYFGSRQDLLFPLRDTIEGQLE